MAEKSTTRSTRITGNEEVSGIDPGGTHSKRPGQRDKSSSVPKDKDVTVTHTDVSADRNDDSELA
jgi:hypothetical protein